jgi:hypothetical protein
VIQSDENVARFLYNEPRTLDETRDFLNRKIATAALHSEGDWLSAAVVLRETGELIGDLALLWESEHHKRGEIGFVFHPAHQVAGMRRRRLGRFLPSPSAHSACTVWSGEPKLATPHPHECSRSLG